MVTFKGNIGVQQRHSRKLYAIPCYSHSVFRGKLRLIYYFNLKLKVKYSLKNSKINLQNGFSRKKKVSAQQSCCNYFKDLGLGLFFYFFCSGIKSSFLQLIDSTLQLFLCVKILKELFVTFTNLNNYQSIILKGNKII